MHRCRAFTLVELVVVVAIVAVLAALAYASYQSQILKVRRGDARKSLLGVAHQLERCYTNWHRYNHRDCVSHLNCYKTAGQTLVPGGVTITAPSCAGSYRITSTDPAGNETLAANGEFYALFAIPLGSQAADGACAVFRYDSNARRTASNADGGDSTALCW